MFGRSAEEMIFRGQSSLSKLSIKFLHQVGQRWRNKETNKPTVNQSINHENQSIDHENQS